MKWKKLSHTISLVLGYTVLLVTITMAAVIANEFTEAVDALYLNALVEIGLVLFVITLVVNALSRLLIWSMARQKRAPKSAPAAGKAVAA